MKEMNDSSVERTLNNDQGQIVWIDIDLLHSHPDNPRKDLGDLTELAGSIRAKGIMQNLTVVPDDTGYTVIIGHRRTAAAKLAGLKKLPCVITEMTPAEQVQTMLLENMQRSDLTAYEQARGFQMMIDFGDSVETVSEKTGFSVTTVRRRLKMAKLDPGILKEASDRQVSLTEMERLFDLDDIDVQNECLKEIGTANFEQKLARAIKTQKIAKRLPLVKDELAQIGAKSISQQESWTSKYVNEEVVYFIDWDGKSPLFKISDGKKYYYYLNEQYGCVTLYTERQKKEPEKKTPEEIERVRRIKSAWERADNLAEEMYGLRRQFIERLTVTAKNRDKVIDGAYRIAVLQKVQYISGGSYGLHQIAGTSDLPYSEKDRAMIKRLREMPEKLAQILYVCFGDSPSLNYFCGSRQDYPMWHEDTLILNELYDWMIGMGYEMSDEERMLRDGTHEVYGEIE